MIFVEQVITEFIYSNITETVEAWNPTTEYLVGEKARVGSYHYKSTYGTEALPNTGKEPLTNLGLAWVKLENEPSNTYACLDPYEETKTTWEADGILEFERGSKNTLGIGNFTATQVKIEYVNALNEVIDTQIFNYSINTLVFDEISYIYAPVTTSQNRVIYISLKLKATKIRVTFSRGGASTDCGYMIAGIAMNMGTTLNKVDFPFTTIGTKIQEVANFNTSLPKNRVLLDAKEAKALINKTMMFIIDESENSSHQNMVIVGKIKQCSPSAEVATENQISWQIEQTILQ